MEAAEPSELFRGTVLVLAPHMDDEALACGGTLAGLPDKSRVHVAYATDGAASPVPPAPWLGAPSPDLPRIRMEEAREAMGVLGIPAENLRFLGLPDAHLGEHEEALADGVERLARELEPDCLLLPFRYDRHPDHLALSRAGRRVAARGPRPDLFEYFVYYRWRLLPGGDVRAYVRQDRLVRIDISGQRELKRRALLRYRTQTTRFFSWQGRPNLTPALLDEVCGAPELFLRDGSTLEGSAVLARARAWVRVAHQLEPALKERKDRLVAVWRAARCGRGSA